MDEIRDLNGSGGHLTRPGLEQAMGLVPTLADGIWWCVAIAPRGGRLMSLETSAVVHERDMLRRMVTHRVNVIGGLPGALGVPTF